MYRVKTDFGEYDVEINVEHYTNGNLALELFLPEEGPFARLTVNFQKLPQGMAYVDTNNCPWAEEFIEENKIGMFMGEYKKSGWCIYPLYRFNVNKIEEG